MNKEISKAIMNQTRLRNRFLRTRCTGIKKLIINRGTIAYLLYGELSNSTITTLIIGWLPIANHFGNTSNLYFLIKPLTLKDNAGGKRLNTRKE